MVVLIFIAINMKNNYSTLFLFAAVIHFSHQSYCQKIHVPKPEATNRVIINNADTVFVFYTQKDKSKISDMRNRFYAWYSQGKILNTSAGFSGKLLHGNYEVFYPNKNLMVRGRYLKGLKSGLWIYWNSNGNKVKEENWKEGLKEGVCTYYDERTNKIVKQETYRKNELSYPQKQYMNDSVFIYTTVKKGVITSDTLTIKQ